MNKTEFLSELRGRLKGLPQTEINNALNFYEEYFNEAGVQNEHKVIEELVSPNAVASKIIGEFAVNDSKADKPKRANTLLIVILAILASPIALPIGITIIVLIFVFFIVLLSLGIAGLAIIISAVAAIVAGFWAIFTSFGTGMYYIGAGLVIMSVGYFICKGILSLARVFTAFLQRNLGKFLIRRSEANDRSN